MSGVCGTRLRVTRKLYFDREGRREKGPRRAQTPPVGAFFGDSVAATVVSRAVAGLLVRMRVRFRRMAVGVLAVFARGGRVLLGLIVLTNIVVVGRGMVMVLSGGVVGRGGMMMLGGGMLGGCHGDEPSLVVLPRRPRRGCLRYTCRHLFLNKRFVKFMLRFSGSAGVPMAAWAYALLNHPLSKRQGNRPQKRGGWGTLCSCFTDAPGE